MTSRSNGLQSGPVIIALMNQKGGCGKTTTAIHSAGALAARGERVLLVDLDPQAHATLGLGGLSDDCPSVAEVMLDDIPVKQALSTVPGGFQLLGCRGRLREFEERSENALHAERQLDASLAPILGDFDWIVIDCPPRADGVLCANALFAATEALLVVEVGAFSLQGAIEAQKILAEVALRQDSEHHLRAVATLFDRKSRFSRDLLTGLFTHFGDVMFDTVIRTSVRLREAAAVGMPVQVLDPTSRACEDFAALTDEWMLARSLQPAS
ncbi:MAG: chromosome partitioning protein [Chlamydiales bacterium]|jgi:chromosome partitioning protein